PLPSTDSVLEIPTGRKGVGDWTIESTASDDGGEGHRHEEGKTTKTVHVLVKALVPKIALDGPTSIKVGDPLRLRTTVTADDYPDHQPLTFAWDVAQAPASGQVQPQSGYSTDASAALAPTTLSDAGTWILKLTVTDMIGTTADKEVSVVVDGPPQPRIQGPQQIGSHAFPL